MRTRQVSSSSNLMSSRHQTVLLHEAIEALNVKPHDIVFDATVGTAGHAKAIVQRLGEVGTYIGMDADLSAIEGARVALAGSRPRIILIHGNFRQMEIALAKEGVSHVDAALFDLGWRSEQLVSGRGFSFNDDGPLLMTYDFAPPEGALTAREIVNEWEEENIADIIYGWGGERHARRIAHAVVVRREEKQIETARDLAEVISATVPIAYRNRRLHPATKTFQALRIAANDEIGALIEGLAAAMKLVADGGRIAVISFHSVEDRVVKRLFVSEARNGRGTVLTKKPINPTREEVSRNPRSRSAKLRIFEKQQEKHQTI